MSFHPDITRKDDISLALDTANTAIALASRQQTGNAGSVTIPNADGTSTVIGAQTGDTTVAKFVGDTTAPGKPTGLTAESHMSTVFVAWDGTLSGGIPADFKFVRFHLSYTDAGNTVESDLCDLYASGGSASPTLPVGTVVTVTARAYDDAHTADGMSTPNISDPATLTVTVVDETIELKSSVEADIKTVSDKADAAQSDADAAAAANTQLRNDVTASLSSVDTDVSNIKTDLASAKTDLANAEDDIDSANTRIQQTSDKVDGLTTTVSNVSDTAGSALSLATTTHQDLQSVTTKVTAAQSDASKALSQASTLSQRADSLESTLSTDYEKKDDAAATYATKSDVTQLSDSITSTVSETYATKDALAALQNVADNAIETWQGHGEPSASTAPANGWTTDSVRASHKGDLYYDIDTGFSYRYGSSDGTTYAWTLVKDTDVTTALQAAYDAQSAADKANTAISKLNTDIPATYATKSEVKQTTDSITSTVASTTTLAQNAMDKATQVEQTADGLTTTVSEQAQDISDNVKTTSQVSQRVDSLNTSITQVSGKADLALANAAELVVNPGFETGDLTGWNVSTGLSVVSSTIHTGAYCASILNELSSLPIRVTAGRTYRFSAWVKRPTHDTGQFGGLRFQTAGDDFVFRDFKQTNFQNGSFDWTFFFIDGVIPSDGSVAYARARLAFMNTVSAQYVDDVSVRDVTDVAAAQSDADAANGKADTAISQSSQTQQDLNGFKASVNQTYETKTDSTAKATTAQQNLDGFKASVQQTYLDKTNAQNTYSTKAEVKATTDQISANLTSVGNTADSAMSKATSAQQSLDGFKASAQQTYATKSAVSDVDAKASEAQKTADDIAVGGRNLFLGSAGPFNGSFPASGYSDMLNKGGIPAADGEYCLSFDAKSTVAGDQMRCYFYSPANTTSGVASTGATSKASDGSIPITLTASMQRYWVKWKQPAGGTTKYVLVGRLPAGSGSGTVTIQNVKFESGNRPTDWTAAPEDTDAAISATYATQSSVSLAASQIRSDVSSTYATKSDVSSKYTSLKQADDAFDARIGTAQSTGANAATAAANAQSRAGVLETLIHSDANGVRVGRTVNGKYQGYSALANANGSFDVVDPGGSPVARFDSDGVTVGSGDESTAPVSMGRRTLPDATAIDPSGAMRASGVVESASGWKLVGQQYSASDDVDHNLLAFAADDQGSAMSIDSVSSPNAINTYRLLQLSDATHVEYTSGWMLPRIRIMSVVRTLKDADRFQVMTATEVNDLLAHAWTPEANLAVGMNGDRSSNTATVIGMDYDGGLNAQLSAKATGGFRVTFAIFDIGWF